VQVISPVGTAVSSQTNNIIVRRIGTKGAATSSNNPVWSIARVRDSLLEDVWGWGNGRYSMSVYGCTNVTVRRGVFRWDGWGAGAEKPGYPKFNLGVYNTHDTFENIVLMDAASDPSGGDKGGLYGRCDEPHLLGVRDASWRKRTGNRYQPLIPYRTGDGRESQRLDCGV
jgi:hypothetical protein